MLDASTPSVVCSVAAGASGAFRLFPESGGAD